MKNKKQKKKETKNIKEFPVFNAAGL